MQIELVEKNQALVRFSTGELLILNNALNEVCHGLNIVEFQTRLGTELGKIRELLSQIGKLIDTMEK